MRKRGENFETRAMLRPAHRPQTPKPACNGAITSIVLLDNIVALSPDFGSCALLILMAKSEIRTIYVQHVPEHQDCQRTNACELDFAISIKSAFTPARNE